MKIEIILALLALIVAILAFLRDVFDFKLPFNSTQLPRWLKDYRTWISVVFLLLLSSTFSSISKNRWLQQNIDETQTNLNNVIETRNAQSIELNQLSTERYQLQDELTSIEATRISQASLTGSEICDEIVVTALPEKLTITLPTPDEERVYKDITYQVDAPIETGLRILIHSAELILVNGENKEVIERGPHPTHFDKQVIKGQSLLLNDGVNLNSSYLNRAMELNSNEFIERKTFHLITDEGIYCNASIEVPITIVE